MHYLVHYINIKNVKSLFIIINLLLFSSLKGQLHPDLSHIRYDGFYLRIEKTNFFDTIELYGKEYIKIDTGRIIGNFIFFYTDGKIAMYTSEFKQGVTINKDYFLNHQEKFSDEFLRSSKHVVYWGTFNKSNDTIFATSYARSSSGGHVKIHLKIILNTSNSILMVSEFCRSGKTQFIEFKNSDEIIYSPPLDYDFISFISKPDSSEAWFNNKRWFRNSK